MVKCKLLNVVLEKIIFSDEKTFNLDGPDENCSYWRDLRKEPQCFSRRNFGGGSVLIWGAFTEECCRELQIVPTKMNSEKYCELLQCSLLPFLHGNIEKKYIFQRGNVACHARKFTKEWLNSNDVDALEWTACSPDINPIENIWGILLRRIYADNRQFMNVNELKN